PSCSRTASSTMPIPPMRADWTGSGACTSGSTAPPWDATRMASGGVATTSTREEDDDEAQDRGTGGVARRAAPAARGGEGATAARGRAGAAATGAAVGSDRQGVSIRDRRGERLAGRPLPGALAAPRLPLHVRA